MPQGRIEYYLNSGTKYTLNFDADNYEYARKLFNDYLEHGFDCTLKASNTVVINMNCVEKVMWVEDN